MADTLKKLKENFKDQYDIIDLIHDFFFKSENKDHFLIRVLTGQDREVYLYNQTICISIKALPNMAINEFVSNIDNRGFSAFVDSIGLLIRKK